MSEARGREPSGQPFYASTGCVMAVDFEKAVVLLQQPNSTWRENILIAYSAATTCGRSTFSASSSCGSRRRFRRRSIRSR